MSTMIRSSAAWTVDARAGEVPEKRHLDHRAQQTWIVVGEAGARRTDSGRTIRVPLPDPCVSGDGSGIFSCEVVDHAVAATRRR